MSQLEDRRLARTETQTEVQTGGNPRTDFEKACCAFKYCAAVVPASFSHANGGFGSELLMECALATHNVPNIRRAIVIKIT
jgi:hypothetical protein